jgi:hypothetical protein
MMAAILSQLLLSGQVVCGRALGGAPFPTIGKTAEGYSRRASLVSGW